MQLSPEARAALDRVVLKVQSGDLAPVVEISLLRARDGIPCDRWTLSNRVLAFFPTGTLDCRGFRQWQEVSRYVMAGAHAAYILAPITRPVTNPDTGEEQVVLLGFRSVAVFPVDVTDRKPPGRRRRPLLRDRPLVQYQAAAQVCRHYSCNLPLTEAVG